MKFFILLLIIFSSVLYSCQDSISSVLPEIEGNSIGSNEDIPLNTAYPEISLQNLNISVENGVPEFETIKDFFDCCIIFQKLSDKERIEQENELGFYSMKTAYQDAWAEYEGLQSYEEYLSWKSINYAKWIFEDKEAFFHMPIKRSCDAYAINWAGEVKIGNKLHNLKNYNDSFYENNSLKSVSINYIELPDSTCAKNYDKRRIQVKLHNQGYTSQLTILGFKKYLWSWHRYRTNHYFEILSGPLKGYGNKCIKIERPGGPVFFNDSDIQDGLFHAEGEGLSYTFISPKPEGGIEINSSAIARIVDIKGWTRGVPEEIACTVSQHYW